MNSLQNAMKGMSIQEPGQSVDDPKKKWGCRLCIYHVALTLLILVSLAMASYSLYRVRKTEKNRSNEPEMLKAHVTLNATERVVQFPKGEDVKGLRYRVIRKFSDLLLDKVPPSCVRIQKHNEVIDEYVDLPLDLNLEEDIRVKAKLPTTIKEWRNCNSGRDGDQSPIKFHKIVQNTTYRLWSPVYGGSVLQRGGNNVVQCGGNFTDNEYRTVVMSRDKFAGLEFTFIFKENADRSAKMFVLNGKSEHEVVATEIKSEGQDINNDTMIFTPDYYFSFTVFRNKYYKTLYLGCDSKGNSILVPMGNPDDPDDPDDLDGVRYPDARALFIVNDYNLVMAF